MSATIPTTMTAYVLDGGFSIDNIKPVSRPVPTPGPGEVLVRVLATSLNYRDLMVAEGKYNPKLKMPLVPLSDGAGEIAAVGDGVTSLKPGDRVAGIFRQAWLDGPLTDENHPT